MSSGEDAVQKFIRERKEANEAIEDDAVAFGHIPGLTGLRLCQRPDGAVAVGELTGGRFVRYGPWRGRAAWGAPWRVPGAVEIPYLEEGLS